MASLKEIKRRIKSVKNTEKITYAMKLVSAAKLRKIQEMLIHSREYAAAMTTLINNMMRERADVDDVHPIMQKRDNIKNIRLVVIGGRRGLCGAYNSNLNRLLESTISELSKRATVEVMVIGKKPAEFCKHKKYQYINDYEDLHDNMDTWPIDEIYQRNEDDFLSGKVDEVIMLFSRFKSAMSVIPSVENLLPLPFEMKKEADDLGGEILYKPSMEVVFTSIIPKFAKIKLYQACIEAKTSEQGARMTAMDAATHNAGELINSLVITHNKLRQASITNDILDIIGGSSQNNN